MKPNLCLINAYIRYFISRLFGSALNFDSATYERLHQEVVVQPVSADARREDGMLRRLYYRVNPTTLLKSHLATLEDVVGTDLEIREISREFQRPRKNTPHVSSELQKVAEMLCEGDRKSVV